jgi:hypothetical protein
MIGDCDHGYQLDERCPVCDPAPQVSNSEREMKPDPTCPTVGLCMGDHECHGGCKDTKPYAANGRDRGHVWKTYEGTDDVDIFGFNPYDPHNGPICVRCGYGYCHHCQRGPDEDCPGERVSDSEPDQTTDLSGSLGPSKAQPYTTTNIAVRDGALLTERAHAKLAHAGNLPRQRDYEQVAADERARIERIIEAMAHGPADETHVPLRKLLAAIRGGDDA